LGRSGQRPELSQATGMLHPGQILRGNLPLLSPPFRRSHFRHHVPPRPLRRERSQQRKVELWARILSGNCAEITTSMPFRDLLHASNLGHGTDGFTSAPKEGVLRIFFALKNPMASARFEPANLGSKGQHATTRPPKRLGILYRKFNIVCLLCSVCVTEIIC
jgi:hypothetical protein